MEIAKITLEYIQTLIWPIFLGCLILLFRTEVARLFRRLTEGREYEFEIAGQKLKVNIIEKAVKTISKDIESAFGPQKDSKYQNVDSVCSELHKLASISQLTDLEIRFLTKFYTSKNIAITPLSAKYESAEDNLKWQGIIKPTNDNQAYVLTEKGEELLNWILKTKNSFDKNIITDK